MQYTQFLELAFFRSGKIHMNLIHTTLVILTKNAQMTTIDNTKKYLLKGLSIAKPSKVIGGAVITPDVE